MFREPSFDSTKRLQGPRLMRLHPHSLQHGGTSDATIRSGSIEGTRPATSSAPASDTTTTKVSPRHESRLGACAHGRANHIDSAVALVRFPRNGPAMPALLAPPAAHHTSGLDGSTRGRSTKPYLIGPAVTRWRQSTKGASCERQLSKRHAFNEMTLARLPSSFRRDQP